MDLKLQHVSLSAFSLFVHFTPIRLGVQCMKSNVLKQNQLRTTGIVKTRFCNGWLTFLQSFFQTTALDKERQILRRGRHQNVSAAPQTTQPTCSLHIPAFTPRLYLDLPQPPAGLQAPTPNSRLSTTNTTPESEDFSACSTETVRSLLSPF